MMMFKYRSKMRLETKNTAKKLSKKIMILKIYGESCRFVLLAFWYDISKNINFQRDCLVKV